MKNTFLILLLCLGLQACSKKQPQSSSLKNKIVLGAFRDVVSEPTLNEDELEGLPRNIDFSEQTTAVKNQGSRGTCTFFSTMALIESSIKIDLGVDVNLSEEYLNYATKSSGSFADGEGSNVYHNKSAISRWGLLLERDWGYQPSWFSEGFPCADYKNTDATAPAECFSHNRPDDSILEKRLSAEGLGFGSLEKNTTDIIKFLAQYQRPLTLSLVVNFNGWRDDGETFYNEELREECLSTPSSCGMHSVLLTGYDLDKKVFYFKNSWGYTWGNKGFGTVSFETVDKYVDEPLYWAQADEKLTIPEDHEVDNLVFNDFNVKTSFNENLVNLKLEADLNNISGKFIYVSSYVVAKRDPLLDADDSNTFNLQNGDTFYRALAPFVSQAEVNDVLWSEEDPFELEISVPTNVSENTSNLLRTTIYVHNDIDTYKVLKRIYHPIQ